MENHARVRRQILQRVQKVGKELVLLGTKLKNDESYLSIGQTEWL